MLKRTVLLLSIALLFGQVASAQNDPPLSEAKHLIEEMYPELMSGVLHATYRFEQDQFSTPGFPLQMQVRVDEYCYPKPDPRTGALPVPSRFLCADVDRNYQPKLTILFHFTQTQGGRVILEGFYTDGTIFQGRSTLGSEAAVSFKFGPDKKAQILAMIPTKSLEKLLGTRLAVTETEFSTDRNEWLVVLKGNGKFLLVVEPVTGLVTHLQTLDGPVFKKRSRK